MKCCDENHGEEKKKNSVKKHMPHMLMMLLCCGLPILLLLFIPLIISANPVIGNKILPYIPFLCPVLMVGMMIYRNRKEKKSDPIEPVKSITSKQDD